ncbi:MAG: hypothetical protein EOS70_28285 [Mesorhizobium sp.]|uniref:hypothetical protein n=1 Tax=unclassified Mesorhizobium TaxID=325217 RepID=UPI000FEA2652|nr:MULTISPECIES: hypothetical protein [unclassified Mesorhizobium]RWB35445.1 MAG: hypothetical protein EOQ41_04755 [Mesorhizobium sp.]RWC24975.1 MAG: hypothetical protein EOS51_01765 [Mesorhizobium sp.]RWC27959.1 MAG: hypothetical protein EOS70_28285 [Mesorhizobium sp.]RWD45939.1 MAG: hypothetical protein EOS35_11195 [Mesorhizobium sp.]RWE54488.1 MAG: hypothetical protein EOS67_22130 [Mesorhizobium sp.]
MADDDFVQAYRSGGIGAVNDLVTAKFGTGDSLIDALETMEDTGLWRILWHEADGKPDFGAVMEYLGDD